MVCAETASRTLCEVPKELRRCQPVSVDDAIVEAETPQSYKVYSYYDITIINIYIYIHAKMSVYIYIYVSAKMSLHVSVFVC